MSSDTRTARMSRRLQTGLFWRSLMLQASWNPQRMQNLGLLTIMLTWLRARPRDVGQDRLFCRRYFDFFNTNPYLANYLVGGLVRLEDMRAAGADLPPGITATFRDTVGRALASLGDQLFWLGLRPTLIMAVCLLGMEGRADLVLLATGVFALGSFALRWLALGHGYALGMDIVDLLNRRVWHLAISWGKRAGVLLTGMVGGSFVARIMALEAEGSEGTGLPLWVGIAVGIGLPLVLRRRYPGEVLVIVALVLGFVLDFAF
jgi:mannose/fructose/N-acetylgalactosamine-specific phosphotransferase system component IID